MIDPAGLTEDGFLDGRLRILQPRAGYRAATDPVILAAAVPARPGERVLELGCGAGVASLCLGWRVAGLDLTGVERQAAYADLARRNAERNGVALRVIEGPLESLPEGIRAETFDQAMANPPYFRAGGGTAAADRGREAALREDTPLAAWADVALRRLRPGGWLTVIHLAERLPDLLSVIGSRAGSVVVLPVAARQGRPAARVVVRARKGGRGAFRLLAPLILHEGVAHRRDGDDFSDAARAVLRAGTAIDFGR